MFISALHCCQYQKNSSAQDHQYLAGGVTFFARKKASASAALVICGWATMARRALNWVSVVVLHKPHIKGLIGMRKQ